MGFTELASTRKSVRMYSAEPPEKQVITSAVSIAIKTPSVCNRQPWRIHYFTNKSSVSSILDLQNGNRSFRDEIKALALVTVDLNSFFGPEERHQCFIDGGMFSMSFLYALHSMGLAACALNWAVNAITDIRIRTVSSIPKNEEIIMMIAIGNYQDEVKIPKSERYNSKDILFFH